MATGKTWLELTNAVLTRLREPTVTTVSSTTYTSLIGAFVNEVKREVEDDTVVTVGSRKRVSTALVSSSHVFPVAILLGLI